jgi:hypothetical protein
MTNLDGLFAAFSELCGEDGPTMTREALAAEFRGWCAERGVSADDASQAAAYLVAIETEDAPAPHDCGPDCPCACVPRC